MQLNVLNGSLILENQKYQIPNVNITEEIGRGANGIVLKGQHKYLERIVVVKIWIKLRKQDQRDKFQQGIYEAKKLDAVNSKNVLRIFDAGEVGNLFYAVMDFIPGITCKQWLKEFKPSLLVRCRILTSIIHDVFSLGFKGILHGDLHTENILIIQSRDRRESEIQYRIIDFGTLYFTSSGFSESRHWAVFNKTGNEIIYPFNINKLWESHKPELASSLSLYGWYVNFLNEIPIFIRSFGINLQADYQDSTKWIVNPQEYISTYSDINIKNELDNLYKNGTLVLTPEVIGIIHID